jgi:predicted AAA+ superfamily ATPase
LPVKYIPRLAEARLRQLAGLFPAVAVTGPRQSGKTTLLRHAFPEYGYRSFDLPEDRAFFGDDPVGFLAALPDRVVLDEVQKVPAIFEYLKAEIDRVRLPGRFLLTGSAQFSMLKGITESLAGRCGFLSLLPFQREEHPKTIWKAMELGGGYPEVLLRGHRGVREWYDAYLTTYLERDLRSLLDIGKLKDFRVVLGLLAARTAQELNLSSIAREAGVNEKTVAAWISVLEASYVILPIPSFHRNFGKRLVKRPKLYFWDTGLACHLTGVRSREILERGPMAGAIFENYVISEIAKDAAHRGVDRTLYYFRTNAGIEADFVLEDRESRRIVFGEVKRRLTVRPEDLKNIRILREASRKMQSNGWSIEGLLVNAGSGEETLLDGTVVRGVGAGRGRLIP